MTAPHLLPAWLHPSEEVQAALRSGQPIVALESTVLTHGLPRPTNLELGQQLEAEVRAAGAVPGTVAIVRGRLRIGLSAEELEYLALEAKAVKASRRDLGWIAVQGGDGGTTVAATLFVAHAAGVRFFATGGIGGVHRGNPSDISADLPALAATPVAVVCAGAKSILDLPRTLEWLETAGVPVLGWGTDTFPAFYSRISGLAVQVRGDTAGQINAVLRAHWSLGLGGALVAVPCPAAEALAPEVVEEAILAAEAEAQRAGIGGNQLTPFLLEQLFERTDGASLRANLALLKENARRAAALAVDFGSDAR